MLLLFFSILFSCLFCQNQIADGILAVVGSQAVLLSEVVEETGLIAQQKNITPQKNPYLYDKLFRNVLDKRVDNMVVLNFALLDSTLSLSYSEIKICFRR